MHYGKAMKRWLAVFMLMMAVSSAHAGELVLKNGDRITGTVESIVEGKLHFTADLFGSVAVDMTDVQTFSSDAAVTLVLSDGSIVSQPVSASQAGHVRLEGTDLLPGGELSLDHIQAVNPPPPPEPHWEGNLSLGWTSVHGNTTSESLQASAAATRRGEKDRVSLGFDYGRSKQEDPDTGRENTTEDWWKLRGKYDYFLTDKWYGFVEGRYETDKIAQLDRRIVGALGLGYQWIESDDMNFSTEAGVAYLTESFRNSSDDNDETSAHLGYHFDKRLTDRIKFINDLTYYPSFGQFSDYYLTTTAEVRASVTENMFTNFKTIFDYDTSPAPGQGSTDVKYILGVGWNF